MKLIRRLLLFIICISILLFYSVSCNRYKEKQENKEKEKQNVLTEEENRYEKGYDLPIKKEDKNRVKKDCLKAMKLIEEIYAEQGFEDFDSAVISEAAENKMMKKLKQMKQPVISRSLHFDMIYYNKMEQFLLEVEKGRKSKMIVYQLQSDGGIGRSEFSYDGKDMYLLYTSAIWNNGNKPVITGCSKTKIKEWNYTEKGWFTYELSVPEYPDVTEIVDGTVMFRIKPIRSEYRAINERFLIPIGYQGNNLFCSDWDKEHLKNLDYNALFEYLYLLKHQNSYKSKQYPNGIPEQEFEQLFMEFLPVTKKQLRTYGGYKKEQGVYDWVSLDSGKYMPNEFGSTIPEIIKIEKNKDGTSVLTIDAVCESLGLDQLFQHKLKVRFLKNGSIQFMSNHIDKKTKNWIPDYQFRIPNT